MSQLLTVKKYQFRDRDAVRKICCDTAFMGGPVEFFFDDRKVFADAAISYYTDFEPESLFVAQGEDGIIGYLAGCRNTRRFKMIYVWFILPKAILSVVFRATLFKKKNWRFIINLLKSLFRGELKRPDCSREFPAHLHVNVRGFSRRLGAGGQLMEQYLSYLRRNKVSGVHLYSLSAVGQQFFQKQDFHKIFAQRVSYFDYLGQKGLEVFCFARSLE